MGKMENPASSSGTAIPVSPLASSAQEPVVGEAGWKVADLIVSYLENFGVDHVFGISGGAVQPLFDALARSERRGGPRLVAARHEAGAAFMADGYARETGKIGVCVATSGPGATNLITGIASAHQNGIPLLAITGQPPLPQFGRNPLQESSCTGVDIVGMFRHCTRYNSLVSHVDQTRTKLAAALIVAAEAPRGPAHLSIPVDILRHPVERLEREHDLRRLLAGKARLVDMTALLEVKRLLDAAIRPVFLIGGNHSVGAASAAIVRLAEHIGALFITTPDGKGFVDPGHPAYRGVFGRGGHESARALLATRPDAIVAFGASFGEFASEGWSKAVLNERLVHFDDSVEHLMRTPMARLHIRGSIAANCERLVDLFGTTSPPIRPWPAAPAPQDAPSSVLSDTATTPTKPQQLMQALARHCTPATRFVADTGNSFMWAAHSLEPGRRIPARPGAVGLADPVGWLRLTMDFAAMGWAIGCAVGIASASPNRPVVCITGDGSYLMSGQEITVAQEEGLTVVFVVLNDGAYGMVMHGQRLAGAEPIGFALPNVDFCALARAAGVPGHVVECVRDLDALDWDAILSRKGPTMLDVRIDREEVPPMGLRLKALDNAVDI
jgi:acetolactate synthase-1/2/3 large subunit